MLRIILLFLIIIPFQIYSQTYNQLKDSALIAYEKENYLQSAALYRQITSYPQTEIIDFYNSACTHSLAGQSNEAVHYLSKAFQKGYDDFDWMYYDMDLNPIRNEPEYLKLEDIYRPDSTIYYDDIVKLLLDKKEVVIENRKVSLMPEMIEYSDGEIKSRWHEIDTAWNFSDRILEFKNCKFPDNSELRLSLPTLNALIIGMCEAENLILSVSNIKLKHLIIQDNTFNEIRLDQIETDGIFQFWHNKIDFIYLLDSKLQVKSSINSRLSNYNGPDNYANIGFHVHDEASVFAISNTEVLNSSDKASEVFSITLATNNLTIQGSFFDHLIWFRGHAGEVVNVNSNNFLKSVGLTDFRFPEDNCYIPFDQFKSKLVRVISPQDGVFYVKGDSNIHFRDKEVLNRLVSTHKYLYDNYRARGELESANSSYVRLKELEIQYLKQKVNKTSEEQIRLGLNQLMGFYTNHGTSPGKAIIISIYIILIFAVFYFFFPSEWDRSSKSQLVKDFRLFIEKNEHGYFLPFLRLVKGFSISFINAITLSVNGFITLGFGSIPTRGLAKYVCVFQGMLGWFLLSLFTVALINEVLL